MADWRTRAWTARWVSVAGLVVGAACFGMEFGQPGRSRLDLFFGFAFLYLPLEALVVVPAMLLLGKIVAPLTPRRRPLHAAVALLPPVAVVLLVLLTHEGRGLDGPFDAGVTASLAPTIAMLVVSLARAPLVRGTDATAMRGATFGKLAWPAAAAWACVGAMALTKQSLPLWYSSFAGALVGLAITAICWVFAGVRLLRTDFGGRASYGWAFLVHSAALGAVAFLVAASD